jgi:hypothetical protein
MTTQDVFSATFNFFSTRVALEAENRTPAPSASKD